MPLLKEPLRKFHAGTHVGESGNHGIEIDIVAALLFFEPLVLAAQHLESAAQLADLHRIASECCVDEVGIAGLHVDFPQHAPVLAIMAALVVPFVVEHGAIFVVRTLFDRVRRVFCSVVVAIVAATGRRQVFIGDFTEVLADRLQQVIHVLGQRYRRAVEGQFDAIHGIGIDDRVSRPRFTVVRCRVRCRSFGQHFRQFELQFLFFAPHACSTHARDNFRVQCSHVTQMGWIERCVELIYQRETVGSTGRGIAQTSAFGGRFDVLAQRREFARQTGQVARDDGIDAGGFQIVIERQRARRIGVAGEFIHDIDVERAVAGLRPQMRGQCFVGKEIPCAGCVFEDTRGQVDGFGVGVGFAGYFEFQPAARQSADKKLQHVPGIFECDGMGLVPGCGDKRVDVLEDGTAAIQTFAVEGIHRVNDPGFGGGRLDFAHDVGSNGRKLVSKFAAGARDDADPVQHEILQFTGKRCKRQRERARRAPRRQDGVERFVQLFFQPGCAQRHRGRGRIRRASWRVH